MKPFAILAFLAAVAAMSGCATNSSDVTAQAALEHDAAVASAIGMQPLEAAYAKNSQYARRVVNKDKPKVKVPTRSN
jgi:hypothetical protein